MREIVVFIRRVVRPERTLLTSVVTVGNFYLISWLNETQSRLSTEVSCFDYVSLPSSQWVVLKRNRGTDEALQILNYQNIRSCGMTADNQVNYYTRHESCE